jgi:hypothetical protein
LPSDFRAKKQKKRVKNPPHLLPPLFVFPNGAAINVGFDDGHTQMVKLKDLRGLYWHNN